MVQRSVFITVVAWIFIVLSGLGILESIILLFVPWQSFLAPGQMQAAQIPYDAQLVGAHAMRAFLVIWLILTMWVFVSSVGLLLRKNWARISYIVMMALGIGWNAIDLLVGILMIVIFHSAEFLSNPAVPPGTPAAMSAFMTIWIIFAAVFLALFIWILIKLTSEAVAREFRRPAGLQA